MTTVLMRTISTQIGSVRNEMLGLRSEMLSGLDGVRMDGLDRDIRAVANHVFGTDRP